MSTASISQLEISLDHNIPTAIVYSVSDLAVYMVEIRHQDKAYFVSHKEEPQKFGNLGEAILAARAHKAEQAFLALDKTYQEVEAGSSQTGNRYDYMPLELSAYGEKAH